MPSWALIVIGILGTSTITEFVKGLISSISAKLGKKSRYDAKLDAIEDKLAKIDSHTSDNYMSILRLTIMSESMPMSERLLAGDKYVKFGGNGDVKHYYAEHLLKIVNGGDDHDL